jgi:MFS-type transporter involved in bile tolerance (Atg22 family)
MALGLMLVGVIAFVAALVAGFMAGWPATRMIWSAFIVGWLMMGVFAALHLLDEWRFLRRQRRADAERGGKPGAGGHER